MKRKIIKNLKIQNPLNKLSLFQKNDARLGKNALSGKDKPVIDYKNIKLLKKYITENSKIISSRTINITN